MVGCYAVIKMVVTMSVECYEKYDRLVIDERRGKKSSETIIVTITVSYNTPGELICKDEAGINVVGV